MSTGSDGDGSVWCDLCQDYHPTEVVELLRGTAVEPITATIVVYVTELDVQCRGEIVSRRS